MSARIPATSGSPDARGVTVRLDSSRAPFTPMNNAESQLEADMGGAQLAAVKSGVEEVPPRHADYPGFCIVFDDEVVERDEEGYFIKPESLAGTHPRDYACGDEELIIRMPAEMRA